MADKHTNLIVSAAPHVNSPQDTASIMRDVCIALIPAVAVAVYVFGLQALILTLVCCAASVFLEWVTRRIMGRSNTVGDWSAMVTGLILALNLPVSMPYWMAIIGCFAAVVVAKQIFGGLGQNFANPANVGRIALFIGFATQMSTWAVTPRMSSAIVNVAGADAVSGPTPLGLLAKGSAVPTNLEMFLGNINGSMGEISAAALLIGGVYLVIRKVISPVIPVSFIGSVAVMALIFGQDPIFQVCAGGVMLGAIFMATDYVTSPITNAGKVIFGIGCGVLTMFIRMYGSYPEGVSFAILFMNILVPHIDNATKHVAFGQKKGGRK